MRRLRYQLGRAIRLTTIVATVLGLVRVPLPQLDYHSIRHQHDTGEVCPYHDHLLRWHPRATADEEVTVLHWHWFTPADAGASLPGSPVEQDGPAWHAHVPVPEGMAGGDVPGLVAGHEPQPLSRVVVALTLSELIVPPLRSLGIGRAGLARLPGFAVIFAPGTARIVLLNRWNC